MDILERVCRSVSYRSKRLVCMIHPRRRRRYERPRVVFMIGMPRSGTTLAKRYLGNHPDLVLAPAGTFQQGWSFAREIPEEKVVIVKNTRLLHLLPEIHVWCGNQAWFLCIVRDPRDELASLLETQIHPEIPRDQSFWRLWKQRHENLFTFAVQYSRRGTKVALARYEDIVRRPEKVKKNFLEWLGLPPADLTPEYEPDPEIAKAPGGAEDWKAHRHSKVHTASIGRWREVGKSEWTGLLMLWKQFPEVRKFMEQVGYGEEVGEPSIDVSGLDLLG